MRGLSIIPALLAILAMLSASAWSSPASACRIDTPAGGGSTVIMSAHHQQHHFAPAGRHEAPAPADPRLDCAACVGVMPALPAMEQHELMPFAPVAESFLPLSGIRPAIDPPPPRGA